MSKQVLFCKYCKKNKEISEFYKHSPYQCKDCLRIKQKKYYGKNKEKIKKDVKEWRRKNPHKEKEYRINHAEKQAEYYRNWYKINGRKRAKDYQGYIRLWRKRNPKAYKAQRLTHYAIKLGFLKKPSCCESCKEKRKLLAHHEDYSKPLEVTWLCYSCHSKLNSK